MIINLRYIRVIFYIIYFKIFEKQILLILVKKIFYKIAYELNLKIYSI